MQHLLKRIQWELCEDYITGMLEDRGRQLTLYVKRVDVKKFQLFVSTVEDTIRTLRIEKATEGDISLSFWEEEVLPSFKPYILDYLIEWKSSQRRLT